MRRANLAGLAAALLLAAAAPPGAASPASAPHCPYPLGDPLLGGNNVVLGGGGDPEYQVIDSTMVVGGNQVQGVMLKAGGKLAVVQEMKVEPPDTDIIMLRWFEDAKGWNGTAYFLSSPDPLDTMPESPPNDTAFHSHVASAVWRDQVWSIWEAWRSVYNPENQALLLRGASPEEMTPIIVVTTGADKNDSVKYGALAPAGDRLMLVYAQKARETEPDEFNLVWRLFDGETFTPEATLSAPSDEWSESMSILVADAGRVYAVWMAQSLFSIVYEIRYAVFDGNGWSAPRTIVEAGFGTPSFFWPAMLNGGLWVAYETNDPYTVNGHDLDIMLASVNLSTGSVVGPTAVNPQPSHADDSHPTLYAAAGRLWIGWSTMDTAYSHHTQKNETDAVYRTFDGAGFGPVVELSSPDDTATDDSPNFVADDSSVYAYWIMGEFPPPPGLKHDWRQAVQLVERRAEVFGLVNSSLGLEPRSANGNVRVWVSLTDRGAGLDAPPMLLTAGGDYLPLEPRGDKWTAVLNASALEGGTPVVSLCGKPVATVRDDGAVPTVAPASFTGAEIPSAAIAAVAAIAVGAWVTVSRRARR